MELYLELPGLPALWKAPGLQLSRWLGMSEAPLAAGCGRCRSSYRCWFGRSEGSFGSREAAHSPRWGTRRLRDGHAAPRLPSKYGKRETSQATAELCEEGGSDGVSRSNRLDLVCEDFHVCVPLCRSPWEPTTSTATTTSTGGEAES